MGTRQHVLAASLFRCMPLISQKLIRDGEAIDEARLSRMTRLVANDETQSKAFLVAALRLRGALSALFAAFTSGRMPDQADIETLNAALAAAKAAERVAWTSEGMRSVALADPGSLDDGLWPIAKAAEQVLISAEPRRVKICGSPTCQWLFLDNSKNATRRWCRMEVCGNREKGRRRLKRERERPVCIEA